MVPNNGSASVDHLVRPGIRVMRRQRLFLFVILVFGATASGLAHYIDLIHIGSLDYSELGAPELSNERRLELVEGRMRVQMMQFRANVYAWWTALGTVMLSCYALLKAFQMHDEQTPGFDKHSPA